MPAYIIMGVPVLSFFHIEEGRTTIFGIKKTILQMTTTEKVDRLNFLSYRKK